MIKTYTVGESVEAWCTKCKLELEHTIIAMVENVPKKVKCNTCGGQHNYRLKPAERSRTVSRKTTRKVKSHEASYNELNEKLTGGDLSHARKYSMQGNFKKDEILDHPTFGIGIVTAVIQSHKMEIIFKDGPRLLSQNQS